MKYSCIIVEDEPLAMDRTRGYVQKLPYLDLVGSFYNGLDAMLYLRSKTVDVLFLDINMSELSGIQLLEAIQPSSQVIMTTAYPEYAVKGFELRVCDYLLKPFTFDRFINSVKRALDNIEKQSQSPEKTYFFVKTEHRLEKVTYNDLLYIEGMRDYRCIYTRSHRIMTLQTFTELENIIPVNIACRVHRSYMVSLDKVEYIERDRIKIGAVRIPISETYKKDLLERIQAR